MCTMNVSVKQCVNEVNQRQRWMTEQHATTQTTHLCLTVLVLYDVREGQRKLQEIRNIQRAQIVETLVMLRFSNEFCSLKVSVEPEPRPRCVMHAQLRVLVRG